MMRDPTAIKPVDDAEAPEDPNLNAKPKVPPLGAAPVPPPVQTPAGGPATATADPMAFTPMGGGMLDNTTFGAAPPPVAPPTAPLTNPIPTSQPPVAPLGAAPAQEAPPVLYDAQQQATAAPAPPTPPAADWLKPGWQADPSGLFAYSGADSAELNPNNTDAQNLAARMAMDKADAAKSGAAYDPGNVWNDIAQRGSNPTGDGSPTALGAEALGIAGGMAPSVNNIPAPDSNPAPATLSAADEAARQERIAKILADPNTSPGIRAAVSDPTFGTPAFDKALNTQGSPESAFKDALTNPTQDYVSPTAPTGPDRFLTDGVEQYANGKPVDNGYDAAGDQARQLASQGIVGGGGMIDEGFGGEAPPQRSAPTGPATDANGLPMPSGGITAAPSGGMLTEGTGLAGGAPTSDPYRGGISDTDPNNSLLGKTLLAGPETDRFKIAGDRFKTWQDENDPYFTAKLRQASQQAAGRGQVGSGMARGALGDIGQQYAREGRNAGQSFLQNALEGSIGDAYKNVDIAQQQQGFQRGQQNDAFSQQVVATQVEEALRNGDFSRAMQLLQAGNQGNPSDTALGLSGIFGGQANAANSALGGLIGNTVNKNAQQNQNGIPSWLQDYLKQIGGVSPTQQAGLDEIEAKGVPPLRG